MTQAYYNGFYKELSKIDAKGNSFEKIRTILPGLEGGESILDIGCGYGTVSHDLVKQGYAVSGIEINEDAIAVLSQKGFKVIRQDITSEFLIDAQFDIILILDVLEHIFDPLALLERAKIHLKETGTIIISVPLYFDIVDRIRILFTGKIVSYDNRCYGETLYGRFRSFNYDHIRFFQPSDVLEMLHLSGLRPTKIQYVPIHWDGSNRFLKKIIRLFGSPWLARQWPTLFEHSMLIRAE